jgi:hypothetical protein
MRRLAAVDVETGRIDTTFRPPTPNAYLKTMALAGTRLYVGGAFTSLDSGTNAVSRPGLAALDAGGSTLTGFAPPPNYGGVFEPTSASPSRTSPARTIPASSGPWP